MLLQNAAIEDNVETFAEMVRSSPPQDMSLLAFYYALDVISQSTFGKRFETMRNPRHRWMCKHLERGNRHMYLQLAWPRLFKVLAIFFNENRLTYPEYHEESKMFLNLCHSHLEEGLKRKGQGEPIYELMKADQPKEISQDELYVDAFSFMRGGGDMVAVTIAAAFHYITQDGDVLQRLTAEVRSTFGTSETPFIGPKLESCRYLRACVDEALRMAPPGPGVFWRTSSADLNIDGVRLPAGTDFGCSIFALHYNEEIFPEPLSFRPERFLEAGARDGGFMPFVRGFRSCPAQKLAYPTILLPVARLVWEFDLSAVPQTTRKDPVPIKEYYREVFGKNEPALDQLYLQVDVFGSRIEGPVLRCAPHG
ncbi:cytochrome P450 like [Lecanosticta acicola]|uniref:Cytochrome P450 like n=1 Tax=Lecanosticta acicola TaxID=111012 RepID=A0AAI8Z0N9_9PEZI|nr:cytochrome P450 like [Lecanosticta acicola]